MVDAAQASSTEPAGIQMDTLTRDGRAKDRPVSRAPSVSSASTFVEQPQPAGPGAGARERRSSFTSVPLNDVPTPRELEQQRPRRRIRYRTQVLSTSTTEISRKRGIFASISLLCIVAAALFIAIFFLYSIVNLRMDVNWLSDKLEFLNNQILQSIGGVPAVYNNTGTVPQNLTEVSGWHRLFKRIQGKAVC